MFQPFGITTQTKESVVDKTTEKPKVKKLKVKKKKKVINTKNIIPEHIKLEREFTFRNSKYASKD